MKRFYFLNDLLKCVYIFERIKNKFNNKKLNNNIFSGIIDINHLKASIQFIYKSNQSTQFDVSEEGISICGDAKLLSIIVDTWHVFHRRMANLHLLKNK